MKRKTKAQRIAAEKTALGQRLADLARGVHGFHQEPVFLADHEIAMGYEFGAKDLGQFLAALTAAFGLRDEGCDRRKRAVTEFHNFDAWDKSWPEIIDHLHEKGFRA